MKPLISLFTLTACATTPAAPLRDGNNVAFGQSAYVDGPIIKPVKLIEDSRCPANARCIWAGRVRISALWVHGGKNETIELIMGEPLSLADGKLMLTDVRPYKLTSTILKPSDYHFSFAFEGGL